MPRSTRPEVEAFTGSRASFLYHQNMPYKPSATDDLPEWIYRLSAGDDCLFDVLAEAWVVSRKARRAVRDRGGEAPRTCSDELEAAEGILDAISEGRVPQRQIARKAAQAVRKFDMAYQCARFLERDDSPRFAENVRVLAAREDSPLVRRTRRAR